MGRDVRTNLGDARQFRLTARIRLRSSQFGRFFGVAFGNLFQGVPFHFDNNLVPYYTGTFWGLLNPFALLCGIVSSAMITFHGAIYLMHRTEGGIYGRAKFAALLAGAVMLAGFSAAGLWLWADVPGYAISSAVDPSALPNPLGKTVVREPGAWLANYGLHPWMIAAPVLAYAGAALAMAPRHNCDGR